MELKFASLSLDQILALSTVFSIDLTQIINTTAPLNANDLSTFSIIWSYALNVTSDELFTNGSQYTFFYRIQTNISITFFVLKVFDLLFLIIKFLFVSVFRAMLIRLRFHLSIKIQVNPTDDLTMVIVKNNDPSSLDKQI